MIPQKESFTSHYNVQERSDAAIRDLDNHSIAASGAPIMELTQCIAKVSSVKLGGSDEQ